MALYRDGEPSAMEALLARYRNFARMKARSYFLAGADKDDIVQEGMIGLYKAIRDFAAERQTSFRAFAEICITRQIITAVKTATRQKHTALNTYVSLSKPLASSEDPNWVLQDVIQAPRSSDPAEMVVAGDEMQSIKMAFAEILSDFEAEVLHMYVEGKSYQEIAVHLDRHVKSIDNALQRIKRKVELHLRTREGLGSGSQDAAAALELVEEDPGEDGPAERVEPRRARKGGVRKARTSRSSSRASGRPGQAPRTRTRSRR